MRRHKSSKERGRAVLMKVDCTHNTCNQIKCRLRRWRGRNQGDWRRRRPNVWMCNVTRNQDTFGTEIHPIERKIGEINSPVLRFLLNMSLETEAVHPTRLACKKAFMHGSQDDSILSAIQAKWPPKLRHQRNSRQILQNRATELCWACSKTIITNSPIHGFLILIPLCSMIMSINCFIGIFVGSLNTNCIKYHAGPYGVDSHVM